MGGFPNFRDPSTPTATAADRGLQRPQPNSGPLGQYTGVPPATRLLTSSVAPAGRQAVCLVPKTRENRFVILTAPNIAFTIFIASSQAVGPSIGMPLPAGIPYEISLPGNQEIFATSNAPVSLDISVQIAPALAGDLERNLG
jgi:hypothetical protein